MIVNKYKRKNDDFILQDHKDADKITCYFCGESIWKDNVCMPYDEFCVEWHGDVELFFHPICAERFATHLIKDVRSGEIEHR